MARNKTYYNSYKGRRTSREKKMALTAVIVILISLLIIAFFVLPEYIVFTAEGFRFTFQKPSETIDEGGTDNNVDGDNNFNIVIDGKDPNQPSENPIDIPVLVGVGDDISHILAESYRNGLVSAALQRGANMLCFNVKDIDGVMQIPLVSGYSSQGSEAANAPEIRDAISDLGQQDIYLAARVSALCDNLAPRAHSEMAVKTSGVTWLDRNNKSWIDPYTSAAAEYLSDIVSACSAAGFDMVILDHLSFPIEGKTDLAEYLAPDGIENRTLAIAETLKTVKATADEEGIALAVTLEIMSLIESDAEVTGQSVAELAQYCHTIYYNGPVTDGFAAELKAAIGDNKTYVGAINNTAFALPDGDISLIAGYFN